MQRIKNITAYYLKASEVLIKHSANQNASLRLIKAKSRIKQTRTTLFSFQEIETKKNCPSREWYPGNLSNTKLRWWLFIIISKIVPVPYIWFLSHSNHQTYTSCAYESTCSFKKVSSILNYFCRTSAMTHDRQSQHIKTKENLFWDVMEEKKQNKQTQYPQIRHQKASNMRRSMQKGSSLIRQILHALSGTHQKATGTANKAASVKQHFSNTMGEKERNRKPRSSQQER